MIRFQKSMLPWFQNKSWCSIHIKTCLDEQWYQNGNLLVTVLSTSLVHRFMILDWIVAFLQSPPVTQLPGADLFIHEESFISSHQELFP